MILRSTILLLVIFHLLGCQSVSDKDKKTSNYDLENVNIGEVKIYADENAKSLLGQLGKVYNAHFPKAYIAVEYRTDAEVMDAIYQDSVRLIVLMRECTSGELGRLKSLYQAKPLQYIFAYDAIALVRDAASTDTLIDSLQLNSWIEKAEDVFVTTKEYIGMFQLLLRQKEIVDGSRQLKIVNDISELQVFLKQNPGYVGLLPFSLVSDQYHPDAKKIATLFRWIGVKGKDIEGIYPSQSTIYTKEWPLILPYTILYSKLPSEKGVGFVKFIHTRQASKLILKSGLIPYNMPERSIKIEEQSFKL